MKEKWILFLRRGKLENLDLLGMVDSQEKMVNDYVFLTIPGKLTSLQVIQTSMYIRQLLQGNCNTELRKVHSLDKNKNTCLGISLMVLFLPC